MDSIGPDFPDLPGGGNYTVTPTSADFAFTPAANGFEDLSANQCGNFTGRQTDFLLAGSIEDENGNLLDGATVTATGPQSASTLTDPEGDGLICQAVNLASRRFCKK